MCRNIRCAQGGAKTDEKRKVKYVQLTLNEEEKKLSGKERIEALQEPADRATDLTQALLEKGADKAGGSEISTVGARTGEFTQWSPIRS